MTAGQRWTAGLALAIAVAVLALGLPAKLRLLPAPAAGGEETAVDTAAPVRTEPLQPASPGTPVRSAPTAVVAPAAVAPVAPVARPDEVPTPLAITAVADATDAAVVAGLLPGAATVDGSLDPTALCDAIGPRPGVVVTALALPPSTVDCLASAGAVVVGHLPVATGPRGSGAVISTALGTAGSLADVGSWLAGRPEGQALVGLVLDAADEGARASAADALATGGTTPVATASVSSEADVVAAQLEFRLAGVRTVVFAVAPVLRQTWVGIDALFPSPPAWVVTDVDLGTLASGDPAGFDGALARTALLPPWGTPSSLCVDAAADVDVEDLELARLAGWCTHASIALDAAAAGSPPAALAAVTAAPRPSLLTTELGPSATRPWGPTATVALIWHSSCACWQREPDAEGAAAAVERPAPLMPFTPV